ncbi:hypothetical protein FRB95_014788 [Tulasnella sp. JGI-2019a]|nr:hypothetical protein FRB95_014788 [Tulasnella sp. JGI-2019a]
MASPELTNAAEWLKDRARNGVPDLEKFTDWDQFQSVAENLAKIRREGKGVEDDDAPGHRTLSGSRTLPNLTWAEEIIVPRPPLEDGSYFVATSYGRDLQDVLKYFTNYAGGHESIAQPAYAEDLNTLVLLNIQAIIDIAAFVLKVRSCLLDVTEKVKGGGVLGAQDIQSVHQKLSEPFSTLSIKAIRLRRDVLEKFKALRIPEENNDDTETEFPKSFQFGRNVSIGGLFFTTTSYIENLGISPTLLGVSGGIGGLMSMRDVGSQASSTAASEKQLLKDLAIKTVPPTARIVNIMQKIEPEYTRMRNGWLEDGDAVDMTAYLLTLEALAKDMGGILDRWHITELALTSFEQFGVVT